MLELREGMDVSKLRFRLDIVNKERKILAVYKQDSIEYPFAIVFRYNGQIGTDEYTEDGFIWMTKEETSCDIIEVKK